MTQDKANELISMLVDAFSQIDNGDSASDVGAQMLKIGALIQAQVQD